MTAQAPPAIRRAIAGILLWLVLPGLGVGYQITSKVAAEALKSETTALGWAHAAIANPWVWAAALFEIAGLSAWVVILSEYALSAAFAISALSYVIVIGAAWGFFGEHWDLLQVVGGGVILVGIWLVADPAGNEGAGSGHGRT